MGSLAAVIKIGKIVPVVGGYVLNVKDLGIPHIVDMRRKNPMDAKEATIQFKALLASLDRVEASLERVYRFLGCPRPSRDPEGYARWMHEHGMNRPSLPTRWGEVYDGGQ